MALLHVTPLYEGDVSSGAFVTLYTVPAGFRVVLRSVNVYNTTATITAAILGIDSGNVFNHSLAAAGAAGSDYLWLGWIVLGPGQKIQGATGGSRTVHYIVSGTIYTI